MGILNNDHDQVECIELIDIHDHKLIPYLADSVIQDNHHEKFKVKNIIVEHCRMEEKEYESLIKIISNCDKLKSIMLNNNDIDIHHISKILEALHSSCLSCFVLSDNWIGEESAMEFVKSLEKQPHLYSLDLSLDWLRDIGIISLANILKNNIELTELNLSCNDFHERGLTYLMDFLINQQHISKLNLSYNWIDSESVKHISKLIHRDNFLKSINLRSNKIQNSGAKYIANSLKENSHLISLDLSDNEIEIDGAMNVLDSAIESKNLTHLNISNNKIYNNDVHLIKEKIENSAKYVELII